MLVRKLETSVAPAMPCKIVKNCGSGASNKIKTKLACILEADESTRMRMGNSIPHHHEDHIAGKGENSLQHYNLVHKFIPMPQAMKIPAAKAAVDKEWGKLEKISAWNLTKVRSKKDVIDEARTTGATVHFASLMDTCHQKNAELETKHQKYRGRSSLRGDIVKDDSGSYAVFTEQGSSASQMTANRCHSKATRMRKTCSGGSISLHPGQHGRYPIVIENSKVRLSSYLDTSTKTQFAQSHGPVWKTQLFFLNETCTVILWQDYRGKAIRESSTRTRLGKVPNWECLFVNIEKGLFLSVYVDDIKLAGKETKH